MKLKSITLKNLDPEIYHRFKVACAEKGITMKQAIINFMRTETENPADMKKKGG